MKTTLKFLSLMLVVVMLSACATQRFNIAPGGDLGIPDEKEMQAFFIAGIGQRARINASGICRGYKKSSVQAVEFQMTFLDALLGGLTNGIFTPRTAKVYCR